MTDISPEDWSRSCDLLRVDGTPYPPAELPLARALTAGVVVEGAEWLVRHPDAYASYPFKREAQTRRHIRQATGQDEDAPVRIAAWSRDLLADAKRLLAEERRAIGRR